MAAYLPILPAPVPPFRIGYVHGWKNFGIRVKRKTGAEQEEEKKCCLWEILKRFRRLGLGHHQGMLLSHP